MEPDLVKELRRHPRVEQHLPVQLFETAGRGKAEPDAADAVIEDLSLAGLSLRSPLAIPIGEELRFFIDLPNGDSVSGNAEVRWARPQGNGHVMGLEIVEIGCLHDFRLKRYLVSWRPPLALRLADMAFQCVAIIVFLFAFQDLLFRSSPASRAFFHIFPTLALACAPVLAAYFFVRKNL